jgi:hypothetical protein
MICYTEAYTQDFTHCKQRHAAFSGSKITVHSHVNLYQTDLLENPSANCGIILKQILNKYGTSVYTGFVCVKVEISCQWLQILPSQSTRHCIPKKDNFDFSG